jgi:hypothetical protein
MQADGSPNNYEFSLARGVNNSYFFTTADDIGYEIKFVPSDYLFEAFPDLQVRIFEMVISVIYNPAGGRLPADPLTAPTILEIFYDFYKDKDQVVVFVCDSTDGRESARARRFTNWFYHSTLYDRLAKIDRKVTEENRMTLLSMILHQRHPQFIKVVEAFMTMGNEDK